MAHLFTSEELIKLIKSPEIIAIGLTVLLDILRRIFLPKAIVAWGIGHQFVFSIPQNTGGSLLLYTKSISVKNIGRAPAKEIEFYFNFKPEHYQVWPLVNHSIEVASENRHLIKIPFLKEGEYFNIEVIQSRSAPPDLINVRAIEGKCSNILLGPQRIMPRWFNLAVVGLLILGIYQFLVWIVYLFQK